MAFSRTKWQALQDFKDTRVQCRSQMMQVWGSWLASFPLLKSQEGLEGFGKIILVWGRGGSIAEGKRQPRRSI